MDKEQILAAARNDKSRGKEYENEVFRRSTLLGSGITIIIGIALYLLEYFMTDSANIGLIAVGMTAAGVEYLYEGLKLKHHWKTAFGIIYALIAVASIVVFVGQVVAA